jgi:protein ImuB
VSAVRTLVVWCPDWPVVAAGARPDQPAVVLRGNRVLAATPAARSEGVATGQRRREAQGRCPSLVVLDHDDARDARAFAAVTAALERYTPRIELSEPGTTAFPTRGPSRYFGGDTALSRAVFTTVDEVLWERGWDGHAGVGVADGAFAARLAARSGGPGALVVEPGGTPGFLSPLPVAALGSPDLVDVLVRLGLRTLGAFGALDAADVVARFGAEGRTAHRLARGLDAHPPATTPPPRHLEVAADLDPPAERVDVAAFVAKSLADELHERLEADGLSCTRILVTAETEQGEVHERVWRHEGALGPGAVADRVRWQLDGWLNGSAAVRPTGGVVRLVITPEEVVPATGRQLGFWGGESGSTERARRGLARVQGLLGPDAVTVPAPRGGRGPGEQVARVPAATVELGEPRAPSPSATAPWPGRVPSPTPAVVPEVASPVEVHDDGGVPVVVDGRGAVSGVPATVVLDGGRAHRVEGWAGPWPADERWWDPTQRRRRARLQLALADGRAVLVYVEGGRWWLEGIYD